MKVNHAHLRQLPRTVKKLDYTFAAGFGIGVASYNLMTFAFGLPPMDLHALADVIALGVVCTIWSSLRKAKQKEKDRIEEVKKLLKSDTNERSIVV